jgi:hypothetical protein
VQGISEKLGGKPAPAAKPQAPAGHTEGH